MAFANSVFGCICIFFFSRCLVVDVIRVGSLAICYDVESQWGPKSVAILLYKLREITANNKMFATGRAL